MNVTEKKFNSRTMIKYISKRRETVSELFMQINFLDFLVFNISADLFSYFLLWPVDPDICPWKGPTRQLSNNRFLSKIYVIE